eukprot:COSAG04_NODE_1848_length_5409_cov_7.118644_7_plen_95_part_00
MSRRSDGANNVADRPRTYAELFGRTHLGAIQGSAQSVNILGTGLGPFILGQGCKMLATHTATLSTCVCTRVLPCGTGLGASTHDSDFCSETSAP